MMDRAVIPSAGPWITDKEVEYVADAVRNGWYDNWSGYIDLFERAFARFIGVRHALSTSSCSGAMQIILRAMNIGPEDEIIVPEVTWIATCTGVSLLGATPVFVDVEPDTWCISPEAVKNAITRKTRAIISVDMYGHPADKTALNVIAQEHNLPIIEDAAPGIGSRYNGKMVGSFGRAAAFSFQGAKPIVTGEGGMIVTDDDDFYDRCHYYWDHCREPGKVLYNTDIGYKFKMANPLAALGLAQLERIDEIINKRRQIFSWYKQRLQSVTDLRLNVERPGCFSNFYVPTIILEESSQVCAQDLMSEMDASGIANRPFFRPLSKLPMFNAAETPVADRLARQGINLPCASKMHEGEVERVCSLIKRKLCNH